MLKCMHIYLWIGKFGRNQSVFENPIKWGLAVWFVLGQCLLNKTVLFVRRKNVKLEGLIYRIVDFDFFFLLWQTVHNKVFIILTICKCTIQWH